jgi:bifunctional DNA-binding transcriptional regulator/antitoxin component of YhaV-PrlF toxin-antitoxin module
MSNSDSGGFGGTDTDLDGQFVTRKVQDGGRINFPDEYLDSIGVESSERVFILVEDGNLSVMKADASNLAITGVAQGLKLIFGDNGSD